MTPAEIRKAFQSEDMEKCNAEDLLETLQEIAFYIEAHADEARRLGSCMELYEHTSYLTSIEEALENLLTANR